MSRFFKAATAAFMMFGCGVTFVPSSASAAYCSATGINVLVDYGSLGAGERTACMSTTSRKTADVVFPAAGFVLTYVTGFPGAVCKVAGAPDSAGCTQMPPANAYWGLYESHGGGWLYSSSGVGGVRLDPGDSVAFVWQDGGTVDKPGAAPGPHSFPGTTKTTAPTAKETPRVTAKAAPKPAAGVTASATPAPSTSASAATATASPTSSASSTPSEAVTVAPATNPEAAGEPAEVKRASAPASADGLPWWVPVGLLLVLGTASAVVWGVRRTRP
jgi:hypothetical protein